MTAQTLDAPSGEQDAAAASIVLFAYIVNNERELERYYRWLIRMGVLSGEAAPALGEYRDHLETTLNYYLVNYHHLLPTGKQRETTDARMSSGMASGPSRASFPGRESDHQGTGGRLTGRRDGTCSHPVR
jgi:hypothetical protein